MNVIQTIKTRLHKYPHIRYKSGGESISIFPASQAGFTVSLIEKQGKYTVAFNGWHEEFENDDEALSCFFFGLSSDCRLKEFRHGNFVYKWTVEAKQDGGWIEDSTTGLLFFPFWRKKQVIHLQNNVLHEERETT